MRATLSCAVFAKGSLVLPSAFKEDAPVTILIDERPDGVHLPYDRMARLLAPYQSDEASFVAPELDSKPC
jgi:hypothetical protein